MRAPRLKALGGPAHTDLAPTRATIVGWERDKGILVEIGNGPREILLATTLVELAEAELDRAEAERREVFVTFEDGDRRRPVILGLIAPVPGHPRPVATEPVPGEILLADDTVIVRGRDAIELRCGEASITLRKDGHILVRGTNLVSRASEQNHIVGGSVHFN